MLYNGMAKLTHMGADIEDLFIGLIYYGTSLLFIVIGNYLPKIKQNNTIGIRIVWIIAVMLCTLHLIKSVSKEACIKAK